MQLNKFLDVKPEVAEAIAAGKPVVALESTIISHGMPYPQNVQTALEVERIIRENGAVPATIAIIGGRLKAGLTAEEIEYFGKKGTAIAKASRRDLAVLCARGEDGATTVTTTMIIAHMAGIKVFATGGIGGVHRGAETTMDISADLEELASTPVMVVCAGAKSILDLGLTLEYLETHGVPVIGYGTKELPAFYTRKSGFSVDYEIDTPEELAKRMEMPEDKVRKVMKIAKEPISMETPIGDDEDSHLGDFIEDLSVMSPVEAATVEGLREATREVLSTLTPREAKVLRMRFGIDMPTDHTLEEVGKQFDVTRERIRQIEAKALRKLRHPNRSEQLRSFLDLE